MGQHATIHGLDTTSPVAGRSGTWRPVVIDANGNLGIRELAGEDATLDAIATGLFGDYTQTTGDLLVFSGPCIVVGYTVTVATATAVINLTDALAAGGTARHVIPIGTAQGTSVTLPPMIFNTGCFVDYTGAATGTIQWIVRGA